ATTSSTGTQPHRSRSTSLESRMLGNGHVRFGGRPCGKGPAPAGTSPHGRPYPHHGQRMGLRPLLPHRTPPPLSLDGLAAYLQSPPATLSDRQGPALHPIDQRPWAVQLGSVKDQPKPLSRISRNTVRHHPGLKCQPSAEVIHLI